MTEKGDFYRFHEKSPYDALYDGVLRFVGVNLDALGLWLQDHPKHSRVIADSLSVMRVGLGYLALRKYKQAREAGDKKGMLKATVSLGVLFATDSVDGYIARKAGIQEGQHGKVMDALSDGILKALIAKTVIFDNKKGTPLIDKVRTASDIFLTINGVREIFNSEYQTTDVGKVKANLDVVTVLAELASPMIRDEFPRIDASLEILTTATRYSAAILSAQDSYTHFKNRRRSQV